MSIWKIIQRFQRSRSHRAADGYPDGRSGLPYASSDDTESYVNIPSRNHSPVPIVQRESSLSRLQEAFADHGTYSPATLDPTTPMRGTPRYSPQQMPMPMPAAFDVGTIHEARHEPHIVSNTPFEGIRPDVMQTSRRHRERPAFDPRPSIEIVSVSFSWFHNLSEVINCLCHVSTTIGLNNGTSVDPMMDIHRWWSLFSGVRMARKTHIISYLEELRSFLRTMMATRSRG